MDAIAHEVNELHPLLRELLPRLPNVTNVEYTHGANEMGADFVFSLRNDTLDVVDFVGVIAKVGKISQDFSDIARQIEECDLARTFAGGRQQIHINQIWVVATGHISHNAQSKIHEKYRTRAIQFIGGEKLQQLIDKHFPEYRNQLPAELSALLARINKGNADIDRELSLLPTSDAHIYIEQELVVPAPPTYRFGTSRKQPAAKILTLVDIPGNKRVILVEGGMGAGKSKLLRQLVGLHTEPEHFLDHRQLPLLVSYRVFVDKYELDVDKLLEDRVTPEQRLLLGDFKILLLIDSVDEKNETYEQQLLGIDSIVTKALTDDRLQVVVTTRHIDGLAQRQYTSDVARYQLKDLSLNGVLAFLNKLCQAATVQTRVVEDLKRSRLFKDMPKNPISAILLARLLNENSRDMPSNLAELYSKYTELTLGRWDIDKGLQSQKEYQALDNLMMNVSKYMLQNDLTVISIDEFGRMLRDYLEARNLEVDADKLLESIERRCEMIAVSQTRGTVAFKHKSFAEFYYARSEMRDATFLVSERAFEPYWSNTTFFYLGLRKDDANALELLLRVLPKSDVNAWLKLVYMGNYFMAAFATPYDVIVNGLRDVLLSGARLYQKLITDAPEYPFNEMSRMFVFFFFQFTFREAYGYKFFIKGLEEAALEIAASTEDDETKAYAVFLANVANNAAGSNESFDFLLSNVHKLPIDVTLGVFHDSRKVEVRSHLMRKQDRRVRRLLRGNKALAKFIEGLYSKPIVEQIKTRPVIAGVDITD